MTAIKKKTRRKRRTKCVITSKISVEGAPFKDKPENGICVGYSELGKTNHFLDQIANADMDAEKKPRALVESVIQQDVGVDRYQLLNSELKKEIDLNYLRKELEKLLKQHKRVNIYRNLALKEAELLFSIDANSETFSTKVVFHILYYIISHMIPPSLLGSRKNFRVFMDAVKRIVNGCYHQWFSLSSLVHGLKVSDIIWLQKALPSNSLRLNILACLVKWLLLWVQTLINKLWYVTIHSSKEKIFHNKRKYQSMRHKEISALESQGKIKMVKEESEKNKIQDIGRIQFLLKTNGMRPIILFRKPSSEKTKQLRSDARMLLAQIAHMNGSVSTSFSPPIDEVLQNGLIKVLKCHPDPISRPPYYFVRVDVRDAFGSVNHLQMLQILQDLSKKFLPSDHRMTVWNMKRGLRQTRMFECGKMPLPSSLKWTKSGSSEVKVITPIVHYIRNSIHRLGIGIGKHCYRICLGIPQGMHLSGVLSEMYYTSLDYKYLQSYQQTRDDEIFVRYCDDYLFVTPCKERAQKFLQKVSTGFPKFNFEINPSKTLTNLADDVTIIPFCGFSINLQNFCVQANFESYKNLSIANTLKLSQTQNLGRVLLSRMKIVLKMSPILLDRKLNSRHTVAQNIYHSSLLMAFRFCAYVQSCFPKKKMNQKFFVRCITLGERVLRRRAIKTIEKSCPGKHFSENEVKWIVYQAFVARMCKNNNSCYSKVLRCLKRRCDLLYRKFANSQSYVLKWATTPSLPGVFSTMM